MAVRLSELLIDAETAQAMQPTIEYDLQAPFDAGSVAKASRNVMECAVKYSRARD